MKKICCLLACFLLLQLLIGCSGKKEDIQQPVNFYYCNKEISYNTADGVIRSEVREGSHIQNIEDLLQEYLNGPISSDMESLIPAGVTVLSCVTDNKNVYVLLSSQFAELSGVKLTTACSAILLTVHDFLGAQTIYVRADGAKLDDRDEFILSIEDVVLMETATAEMSKES